jgi:hypothetical protein
MIFKTLNKTQMISQIQEVKMLFWLTTMVSMTEACSIVLGLTYVVVGGNTSIIY